MPATPLTSSTRFSALDGLHVLFLPLIAATDLTPIRSEINAGTDLTGELVEWSGFTTKADSIETPDLTAFVGKIPGKTTADDSSISIYANRGGTDVRSILPRGTSGFFVWMDTGDTPTNKCDVYPIRVVAAEKVRAMDKATIIRVDVTMTRIPQYDRTIPA